MNAIATKLIRATRTSPAGSSASEFTFAFSNAGSKALVMIKVTTELTTSLNAPAMMTAIARSTTFPLLTKALNAVMNFKGRDISWLRKSCFVRAKSEKIQARACTWIASQLAQPVLRPLILLSSDIRFWPSGDTKIGPPDGLLMGGVRWSLDRCFIGRCRVVVVVGLQHLRHWIRVLPQASSLDGGGFWPALSCEEGPPACGRMRPLRRFSLSL